MHNYSRLNNSIKQIIVGLIDNMEIPNIIYGQVISEDPLQIQIDQKLILGKNQLILTRNVIDYKTEIKIEGSTKRKVDVYNKLKKDETVLLVNLKGGQRYLVMDRVGDI